jgi:serine/threonine-protein kinase
VAGIVAIALAGANGGDGNGTASTTAKKPPSSSSTQKKPTSSGTPAATTPPAAPPAPASSASTGSGAARPSALNDQGYRLMQAGNNAAAVPLLQRSVAGFQASGDTASTNYSYAIYNLGTALLAIGKPAEAIPYLQERLDKFDDRDALVSQTLAKAQAQAQVKGSKTPKVKNRDQG